MSVLTCSLPLSARACSTPRPRADATSPRFLATEVTLLPSSSTERTAPTSTPLPLLVTKSDTLPIRSHSVLVELDRHNLEIGPVHSFWRASFDLTWPSYRIFRLLRSNTGVRSLPGAPLTRRLIRLALPKPASVRIRADSARATVRIVGASILRSVTVVAETEVVRARSALRFSRR
jgi:hypothetical protein